MLLDENRILKVSDFGLSTLTATVKGILRRLLCILVFFVMLKDEGKNDLGFFWDEPSVFFDLAAKIVKGI